MCCVICVHESVCVCVWGVGNTSISGLIGTQNTRGVGGGGTGSFNYQLNPSNTCRLQINVNRF